VVLTRDARRAAQVFFSLNFVYFVLHYLFASQTAHVGALAPAFIGMLVASGCPPLISILSIAYNTNLFGGLSHYAYAPVARSHPTACFRPKQLSEPSLLGGCFG
jgi:di/tricarboxylate transporter